MELNVRCFLREGLHINIWGDICEDIRSGQLNPYTLSLLFYYGKDSTYPIIKII